MSESRTDSHYRLFCRVTLALLFVFAAVYGILCVNTGQWIEFDPGRPNLKSGNDFTAFYSGGEQARLGRNIYDFKSTSTPRRPFEYPPMFAVFPMAPLSLLSHNAALAVFHTINVAMLAASCWMLRKILWGPPDAGARGVRLLLTPMAGILASLALSWRFIGSNTIVGNANLYVLFLLATGLYFDVKRSGPGTQSPRGGILSGLAVALATTIKLTPGLLGVYFLWSLRRWSMVGGALGLALFLFFIPAAWLGWNTNMKYLEAYAEFARSKTAGVHTTSDDPDRIIIGRPKPLDPNDSDLAQGVGVSIRGMLINLLTPAVALKESGTRPRTVNIATLDPKQVSTISNVCGLLLLMVTAALTLAKRSSQSPHAAALAWSLVTVAMTLISPLTRIAHLVVLLIPIATLIALLQQNLLRGGARTLAWAALVLIAFAGMMPDYIRAIGFMTVTLLILQAALAWALLLLTQQSGAAVPAAPATPSRGPVVA